MFVFSLAKYLVPLGKWARTLAMLINPRSSTKLREMSRVLRLQYWLEPIAPASLWKNSHLTPALERCNSCRLGDFATTAKILSTTSPASLAVLALALSLVNQVLCSRAEMMQMRSRCSRCSKSVRQSSWESWEK